MPSYCTGISQPAKGTSLPPASRWRAWSGVRDRVSAAGGKATLTLPTGPHSNRPARASGGRLYARPDGPGARCSHRDLLRQRGPVRQPLRAPPRPPGAGRDRERRARAGAPRRCARPARRATRHRRARREDGKRPRHHRGRHRLLPSAAAGGDGGEPAGAVPRPSRPRRHERGARRGDERSGDRGRAAPLAAGVLLVPRGVLVRRARRGGRRRSDSRGGHRPGSASGGSRGPRCSWPASSRAADCCLRRPTRRPTGPASRARRDRSRCWGWSHSAR